mgnify:FL=1|jgi:Uncharacterized protein conserved in bacteria
MTTTEPALRTLLWRGLCRKCPRCAKGPLFRRWFKLLDGCSVCGLKYLENQGDLWALLLFADRVLFMVPLVVVFFIGRGAGAVWPYVFGVFLAVTLIVTFPHRMGLSVALDYHIRRHSGDLSGSSPKQ